MDNNKLRLTYIGKESEGETLKRKVVATFNEVRTLG